MRAGRMYRRITIQAVTETRSSTGMVTETWADLVTVWAELQEPLGFERKEASGQQARIDRIFRIRHRRDVTNKHRIVYGGINHDIVSILEIGRREGLELSTVARAS